LKKFEPKSSTIIFGKMKVKSFNIPKKITVFVKDNLQVFAEEIVIEGKLLVKDETLEQSNGKSISLTANGDIVVNGKIQSGKGLDVKKFGNKTPEEISCGLIGTDGGNIILTSKRGRVTIKKNSKLVTGNGENGGSAKAIGHSAQNLEERGGNAVAIGGNGGKGGDIIINCPNLIFIEYQKGIFYLGNGGKGGDSFGLGGNGGNCYRDMVPGMGGGVYCKSGDGGRSGLFPSNVLQQVVLIDKKAKKFSDLKKLENLFSGGRGGKPGKVFAKAGKDGKVIRKKLEVSKR